MAHEPKHNGSIGQPEIFVIIADFMCELLPYPASWVVNFVPIAILVRDVGLAGAVAESQAERLRNPMASGY
jgi:hypothetical protein